MQAGTTRHDVHFVSAARNSLAFYRTLFDVEDMDADAYMENARDAFPDIGFVPGLAPQFSRFETKYRDVRAIVTAHLAALNDHFPRLFKAHPGKPAEINKS